jgi:hypothetical protein
MYQRKWGEDQAKNERCGGGKIVGGVW